MDYDRFGATARQHYENFANAILVDYQASRAAGIANPAAFKMAGMIQVGQLVTQATAAAHEYMRTLPAGEHSKRMRRFIEQLHAIALTNVNDLAKRMLAGSNRAADVLTRPAGAVGMLLQRQAAKTELLASDTSGRNWQSDKLVAVMARDFAYQAYVDAQIDKFDEDEVEMVQVTYPDPTHENHGMELRLHEVSLIRRTIFHPNATARLVTHV